MDRGITFIILIGVLPLGYRQKYHLQNMGMSITFRIQIGVSPLGYRLSPCVLNLGYGYEYHLQDMGRSVTFKIQIGISPLGLGYRQMFHLAQLFQRSRLKYEKVNGRMTDGCPVMAIPHIALWARRAKNVTNSYCRNCSGLFFFLVLDILPRKKNRLEQIPVKYSTCTFCIYLILAQKY